jgi:hypothetical protein
MLSNHLEDSKTNLFNYFEENYTTLHSPTPSSLPPTLVQALPVDGSPQKSFTARYRRKEKYSTNELEEYFKFPAKDFDTCSPIQWWVGRRSQFPRLFQLARDILCIPGMYFGSFNSCDLNLSQVLPLPLREFSRVGETPSLSGVLDSNPTQFEHSCLLRSASILPGPKPPFVRTVPTLTQHRQGTLLPLRLGVVLAAWGLGHPHATTSYIISFC